MTRQPIIALFGAGGQVGRDIVARAAGRATIHGLTRVQVDITDAGRVATLLADLRPDVVVNAAAYTAVDAAEGAGRAESRAVNGDGPGILAAACAGLGCPLIHLSTDFVFDGAQTAPFDEDSAPAPISAYGADKLAGEEAVRAVLPAHVILRVAWVFGRHGGNFVKTVIRLAGERDELTMVADQIGGPTPTDAIADAVLTIAGQAYRLGAAPWGTYHFCGVPAVNRLDFTRAILDEALQAGLLPRLPRLVPVAGTAFQAAARRPANSVLACGRLAGSFGISQPDWRIGLARTIEALVEDAKGGA